MRQCIYAKFQLHLTTVLLNVRISFQIPLGSYRPPHDVDFSAKKRVTLLSGHPNGDTQLLNRGTVSFAHVKAARNKCLNPKIEITFLLKYPVYAINRATFFLVWMVWDSGILCENAVIALNPVVAKVGLITPGVICDFWGYHGTKSTMLFCIMSDNCEY